VERGLLNKGERWEHGSVKTCFYTVNEDAIDGYIPNGTQNNQPATSSNLRLYTDRSYTDSIYTNNTDPNKVIPPTPTHERKADAVFVSGFDSEKTAGAGLPGDRPFTADESHLAIRGWCECGKHWNSLKLNPECRAFLSLPSAYDRELVKVFRSYSLKELFNAMKNYRSHLDSTAPNVVRPLVYGSLASFLIKGAPRYFNDKALPEQFTDRSKK
jgi:hypothetical protein